MSFQTDLFCSVTFMRKTYNNRYEVEEDLNEVRSGIAACEKELRDLAVMTEPEKFYDKDTYDTPYQWVVEGLEDNLKLLADYRHDEVRLQLLLDNWDLCHDKDGNATPAPWGWEDRAFLDGDFIKKKEE